MGTRAQFFIGNPQDVEHREWLGCIAWDGYPKGDCEMLKDATTPDQFRALVATLAASRADFTDPQKNDYPFPWHDDIFITDCTYAFFDGATQYASFHTGWTTLAKRLSEDVETWEAAVPDKLVPAPAPRNVGKPAGRDSLTILGVWR